VVLANMVLNEKVPPIQAVDGLNSALKNCGMGKGLTAPQRLCLAGEICTSILTASVPARLLVELRKKVGITVPVWTAAVKRLIVAGLETGEQGTRIVRSRLAILRDAAIPFSQTDPVLAPLV